MKVNRVYLKKIFTQFLIYSLTSFLIILGVGKFRQKDSLNHLLGAVSSIRGYHGLLLDDGGIGAVVVSLLERTGQHEIQSVEIRKNNRVLFTRDFTKAGYSSSLIRLTETQFEKKLDEFTVRIIFSSRFRDLGSAFFSAVLLSILGLGFKELLHLLRVKEKKLVASTELANLAQQLSHDIRSPLSALQMLLTSLEGISDNKKAVLFHATTRIQEIANGLLKRYALNGKTLEKETEEIPESELCLTLLDSQLESMVQEKKLQFQNRANLSFPFQATVKKNHAFSRVNPHEFQRVISNLINNSVEAMGVTGGAVSMMLFSESNEHFIEIRDQGRGMDSEVLKRLGERGFSHEKTGGSGLGLFHAFESVKGWGGKIQIESKKDQGTTVRLALPAIQPPAVFLKDLFLDQNSTLVILDDDESIHHAWNEKLSFLEIPAYRIIHLTTPRDLRKFYGEQFMNLDGCLFLVDLELGSHSETGLDLIRELGLQKQSVLVTGLAHDERIWMQCENLGLKLLPKAWMSHLDIRPIQSQEALVLNSSG